MAQRFIDPLFAKVPKTPSGETKKFLEDKGLDDPGIFECFLDDLEVSVEDLAGGTFRRAELESLVERSGPSGAQSEEASTRATETSDGTAEGSRSVSAVALAQAAAKTGTSVTPGGRQPDTRKGGGRRTSEVGRRSGWAARRMCGRVRAATVRSYVRAWTPFWNWWTATGEEQLPKNSEEVLVYLEYRAAEPSAPSVFRSSERHAPSAKKRQVEQQRKELAGVPGSANERTRWKERSSAAAAVKPGKLTQLTSRQLSK